LDYQRDLDALIWGVLGRVVWKIFFKQ
jgi:hypothetical protein